MGTARRRALWVDFSLGFAAVVFGVLARGTPRSLDGMLIAGTGLFAFVTTLYVAEHTRVLAFINRTRPMSLVLACAMFTAVGVALLVGQGVVATPSATLLFGMGFGFVLYRVRFGVTGPLPDRRLEQARLWGSPPERQP
ncbi:hypothetical protein [Halovenus halobia]|uniref:hypothetical protein n=1 Tax=Halovenus halobia TaxID=3396622 RepID=UPI003F55C8D3